jgi:signal transduction histidine kinase
MTDLTIQPISGERELELVAELGQLLLGSHTLPQRLTRVLSRLRTVIPFEAARIVVLYGDGQRVEPWSLSVPSQAEHRWTAQHTAEVFSGRSSILRQSEHERLYLGWPICWQQHLYGVIEFSIAPHASALDGLPVLEALAPLFAAALRNAPPNEAQPGSGLATSAQARLDELAVQLEAPMLLQPLLALLLQWALEHAQARHGSIHLAESNGHGLHLHTFELPRSHNGSGRPLVPSSRSHDLAKIAIANGQPMIRQVGAATEFAAPIVHDGQLLGALRIEGDALGPHTLLWVQRLAEIAGPAVLRAQFYQQLADARTHLQQVFDELPTGLALTDSEGQLLRANPSWWRLWGLDQARADEIKLVPWDILPRILGRLPDPLAFSDLFTRAITSPNEAVIVLQNPWQELRLLFMPVRDALGLQAGFLLAIDDITREREADRLKTEFVSVVSHELRTPLTSILGYTELLLAREFEPAERREFIHTVHKEADHLSGLVEDLLNVSRLDAGKIKLERWVMALPKLVRELVAQLNAELDGDRHRLLLDVPDSLPPIYADRDRVRQILSNLLSNAIKYSPDGGEVVLNATVLHRPPPDAPPLPPEPAMLITVRDQGIGIPQHELQRIFESFYRVDNTNTRRIGGTGLGLAITRALVELHGGRIWVESTPGEGSTFFLTLPLATEMLRTKA